MPDSVAYVDFPQASFTGRALPNDVHLIGPDTFVAALRALCVATLPELTCEPEALSEGVLLTDLIPPYLVLNLDDGTDVSGEYAVFDEATAINVEFLYVGATLRTGATDTAQAIRARLNLLELAFLSDRTLGGLATRIEVAHTPANRGNQYQVQFQGAGEQITVLGLTMEFHLVSGLSGLYL